ncbi:MAG: DUF3467 domain-containing protein [Phycisphaerae bacterium]
MGDQPNPQQQQQVRIDASRMETVYSNFFAISGAQEEVTLFLGANSPMPNSNQPLAQLSHRVMVNPQNAKKLMIALQQTVKAHEDRFGPIELPATPGQQQG